MNPPYTEQRRVLLASYYFPPDAAVGGLRLAKFARHLREFGWTPYVLTVSDDLREQPLDCSRLGGLGNVVVARTRAFPRLVDIYAGLKRSFRRRPASVPPSSAGDARRCSAGGPETLGQRLKRHVLSLIVYLPDEKKNWAAYASIAAVGLIRKYGIDCVLTSGPPFSAHLIGFVVKALTRATWVADFRDPWIDMLEDRYPNTRSRLSDWIERWMERVLVQCADRVVTTTDRMRVAMAARYPRIPPDRFVTVPNSIDAERFGEPARDSDKDQRFTITYAGALYFDRTPEPLFRAAGALIREGRITPADLRIKFVGRCAEAKGVETTQLAREYGLEDVVEVLGAVPYSEAAQIMRRSHLLLLLAPERHRLVVPAKLFDYVGAGVGVIALAEPGATADLIDETGCGRWFSEGDFAGLSNYLSVAMHDAEFRTPLRDPAVLARFDARSVTGRLVRNALEAPRRTPTVVALRT